MLRFKLFVVCSKKNTFDLVSYIFYNTYSLFTNIIDLSANIYKLSMRLVTNKENLDLQFARFKNIDHESLDISIEIQNEFQKLKNDIYKALQIISKYLTKYFDHINNIVDIILFQNNVTKNDINNIIKNFSIESSKTLYKAQKEINQRYFDFVTT